MVKPIGEDLEKHVKESPGTLLEDLRQQIVQQTFNSQRFDFRVDEQPAVRFDQGRCKSELRFVGHLFPIRKRFSII
jgi:hypothetical protein